MVMTLEDLRVFLVVSRQGSFSAAARELACSQPAVSHHVQRLEQELQIALFKREPRGVRLTDAGEVLRQSASQALGALGRSIERVSELKRGEAGQLVIATGGTTVKHFMMKSVARFRRKFGKVRIQFRAALSSAECIDMLKSEPVELAFVTMGPAVEGVRQQPVLEMDYVLLTSAGNPLAQRSKLTPRELGDIECIGLAERATSRSQLSKSLAKRGVALDTVMTVFDWDTAQVMVELGLGSAIIPSWHAHESTSQAADGKAAVIAVPIVGLPPVRVGWAHREDEALLAPAAAFITMLQEDLKKQSDIPGVRLLV
jgi:DNA-binding transcriptional LysR family regulator